MNWKYMLKKYGLFLIIGIVFVIALESCKQWLIYEGGIETTPDVRGTGFIEGYTEPHVDLGWLMNVKLGCLLLVTFCAGAISVLYQKQKNLESKSNKTTEE